MTAFKRKLEKELERRRNTWFPCKRWDYTDPHAVAMELKENENIAMLRNTKVTRYLKKKTPPIEKIERIVENLNRPNCKYFGQNHAYGRRFVKSITLLDGTIIPCCIPICSDSGGITNLGFIHTCGGFEVAKWIRSIYIEYTYYDYRGYHWSQVDGIPHEATETIYREDLR